MEEYESEVSDMEVTTHIFQHLGMHIVKQTRKYRKEFCLEGAKVVIDDYQDQLASIPVFAEIETQDEVQLAAALHRLGFSRRDALNWDTRDLVAHYLPEKPI